MLSFVARRWLSTALPQTVQKATPTTIGSLLQQKAAQWEHKDALQSTRENVRWTYTELNEWADALAVGVAELFGEEKKLLSWGPNGTDALLLHLAAAKAGHSLLPLDLSAPQQTFLAEAKRHQPSGLFIAPEKVEEVASVFERSGGRGKGRRLRSADFPAVVALVALGGEVPPPGWRKLRNLWVRNPLPSPLPLDRPDHSALVASSSSASHRHLLSAASSAASALHFTFSDRVALALPLSSLAAASLGLYAPLTVGATIVLPSPWLPEEGVLTSIDSDAASVLVTTPALLESVLSYSNLSSFNLASLRSIVLASELNEVAAKKSKALLQRARNDLKLQNLYSAFYTKEAGLLSVANFDDSSSFGRLLPHLKGAICNDKSQLVEKGTLVVQGAISGENSEILGAPGRWTVTSAKDVSLRPDGSLQ